MRLFELVNAVVLSEAKGDQNMLEQSHVQRIIRTTQQALTPSEIEQLIKSFRI